MALRNAFANLVTEATAPKLSFATSVALVAGASVDLDSDQIATGKTGRLMGIVMAGTVNLKGAVKTVQNGVPSATKIVFFYPDGDLVLPDRRIITQAQDAGVGFDGFRLTITNLDISQTADVYTTFFFDEF